jgi:multiple antibiotic resistance protein
MEPMISAILVFAFQLFIIMDAVAIAPIYLSLTKSNTKKERIRIARISVLVASAALLIFAFFGSWIFAYFNISLTAIKIGGGLLLLVIGMEMIYGKYTGSELTEKEKNIAQRMDDISITPLAIPLMAGPGAITTVFLFSGSLGVSAGYLTLALGILLAGLASYIVLSNSEVMHKVLGDLGTKVVVRVMGLIIVFMATQYMIDGVSAVLSAI